MTLVPLVKDLFTDTNGTNLTAHRMDLGGPWVEYNGAWTIQSNKATPPAAPSGSYTADAVDAHHPDVMVQASIFIPNATSYFYTLGLRVTDQNNLWAAAVERDGGGTPFLKITERIASVETTRGTLNFSTTPTNTTITLTAIAAGSLIIVAASTGESISYSSAATLLTGTKHGLFNYNDGTYSGAGTYDNFTITPIRGLYRAVGFDGGFRS